MASKGDAAAELAEQLIRHLEAQRLLGPPSYPLTVGHLLQLANREAAPAQFNNRSFSCNCSAAPLVVADLEMAKLVHGSGSSGGGGCQR